MKRSGSGSALAALALAATLAASIATQAHAYRAYLRFDAMDSCYRWRDTSESMRCFDCLEKVWTARGWQWANTCSSRRYQEFSAPLVRIPFPRHDH